MNSCFQYLYRDASNYKSWGEVVFAGEASEPLLARLQGSFESGEFFIADQVRVSELFFPTWPLESSDHCFHEFDRLETTDAPVDDQQLRSIDDFVAEVEAAARSGWRVFDPAVRKQGRRLVIR